MKGSGPLSNPVLKTPSQKTTHSPAALTLAHSADAEDGPVGTMVRQPGQGGQSEIEPGTPGVPAVRPPEAEGLLTLVQAQLDDDKSEEIVAIDLRGKTAIADFMVIASGRSQRHVGAIADHLIEALKASGVRGVRVEGQPACDWVLIDAGDVIVHVFQPEVRAFYNIEKMWSGPSRG